MTSAAVPGAVVPGTAAAPAIHPIVLGGDAGAYSLARAFDEAYGVRSSVVTVVPTRNVRYSRIVDNVVEPQLDDPDVMIATIRRLADSRPGPAMVVTCVDWYVGALAAHRDRIEDVAVVPYPDVASLEHVMDKQRFSELCGELGVPHPRTVIRRGGEDVGRIGLRYPLIAKPGDNTAWFHTTFPGKRKVHEVADDGELAWLLRAAGDAGYREPFIVQELVPGADDQMRIMTTYSDTTGQVRAAHGGRVLVEEHTPGTLGNPAAILTGPLPEIEEHARRIVDHLGWRGFANFDVKVDPRDGKGYFFELNPRTGRSNYYLTACGINPARLWVEDYVDHAPRDVAAARQVLYRIVPLRLLRKYVTDSAVRRELRGVRSVRPVHGRRERDPRRLAWAWLSSWRQYRRFARWYPASAQARSGGQR